MDSLPAEPQGKPNTTGVGSLSLLQWIIPTQEVNHWGLLHCRQILCQLSYQGNPSDVNLLLRAPFWSLGKTHSNEESWGIPVIFFTVYLPLQASHFCHRLPYCFDEKHNDNSPSCSVSVILFCSSSPRLQLASVLCALSHSVGSQSLTHHGLYPARLLCPWNFPGKNTKVGCCSLLQGIFPNQGLNPWLLCLLHWQVDSLPLCHLGICAWDSAYGVVV